MNDPKNHRGGLAVESGLKTDDGEELSRAELIARIIDPVSFEKVRQGGLQVDAQWRCHRARDKAAHIETLFNTRAPSDAALVEALEWYAEQVRDCRKITSEGDAARRTLDKDGGQRARAALAAAKGQQP